MREKETFKKIFDSVISLINERNPEIMEWAKKVDDLLKNQVYSALSNSYPHFDLEYLISHISEKLNDSSINEGIIVLIKWLEVLHSIQNVNILPSVPKFLIKLLKNMELRDKENLKKNEVSKKSVELLQIFIKEFDSPATRTVMIEKLLIENLLKFLLDVKRPSGG